MAKECRDAIARATGARNIGFNEVKTMSGLVYTLSASGDASKAEAKYPYDVIRVLTTTEGETYWLSASLEFEFNRGNHSLTDVSLLIFKGPATDYRKTPLLRAEWSSNQDAQHAQPHWHIYPSHINRDAVNQFSPATDDYIRDFMTDEDDTPQEEMSEWERLRNFILLWLRDGKATLIHITGN